MCVYFTYFSIFLFNFAPLNYLLIGRLPHLSHLCYGSEYWNTRSMWQYTLWLCVSSVVFLTCKSLFLYLHILLVFCIVHPVTCPSNDKGNRRIAPLILNLGTVWRRVVKFTHQLLSYGEVTGIIFCMRLSGPVRWSKGFEEEKNSLDSAGIGTTDRPV